MTVPAGPPAAERTMGRELYATFRAVPVDWMDEAFVKREIAAALSTPESTIARRFAWLKNEGLIERRGARTLTAETEIRKRPGGADRCA